MPRIPVGPGDNSRSTAARWAGEPGGSWTGRAATSTRSQLLWRGRGAPGCEGFGEVGEIVRQQGAHVSGHDLAAAGFTSDDGDVQRDVDRGGEVPHEEFSRSWWRSESGQRGPEPAGWTGSRPPLRLGCAGHVRHGRRRSARATERNVRGAGQVSREARTRALDRRLALRALAARAAAGRGRSQARSGLEARHVTFGCPRRRLVQAVLVGHAVGHRCASELPHAGGHRRSQSPRRVSAARRGGSAKPRSGDGDAAVMPKTGLEPVTFGL
jgi:hypothetical protein